MKNIHQPIIEIMAYYAKELDNKKVQEILQKESIDTELEAKEILNFLDSMCEQVAVDSKSNIVVLRQPIHTTDAEKVCDVMEDFIEELGYGHLTN